MSKNEPTGTAAISRRGLMLVLSSPSGAGKSTLSRALLKNDSGISMSVSATTRPMRPGETEGEDYFFVDREQFDAMAEAAGRDPKAIDITVYGQASDRALVKSLLDSGANRVVIRPDFVDTEAEMGEQLERIAEEVIR